MLFTPRELVGWRDHSEMWVYEQTSRQMIKKNARLSGQNIADLKEMVLVIPPQARKFEDEKELLSIFESANLPVVKSITTSGNSFNVDACRYIGEKLVAAKNLKVINFSDMFTTRLKTQLPQSLKFMIDAVADKQIMTLNLRDNAFGPAGIESLKDFLASCPTLKILNVTNCGLGPEGTTTIAQSLLMCEGQQLEEFYASRDRLEDPGFTAMAQVFSK